jgi:hypothetical protein
MVPALRSLWSRPLRPVGCRGEPLTVPRIYCGPLRKQRLMPSQAVRLPCNQGVTIVLAHVYGGNLLAAEMFQLSIKFEHVLEVS